MSAKGIWIAFGVGVAAGSAIALLYAPQSGERTRRQLKKKYSDGVDYLEDAAEYLREQADSLSKEAQKAIKRTRGQVGDAFEKVSDKVSDAATGAVKSVQSLM